jgi:hypothetical protein
VVYVPHELSSNVEHLEVDRRKLPAANLLNQHKHPSINAGSAQCIVHLLHRELADAVRILADRLRSKQEQLYAGCIRSNVLGLQCIE